MPSTTLGKLRLIRRFRLRGIDFPVDEFVKPARLKGVENGRVPDSMLATWTDHRGKTCRMMSEFLRPWKVLVWLAFVHTGLNLTFTSPADVYRTYDQQATMWKRRNTRVPLPRPSRMCGYPDGIQRRWWLLPLMAGCACPGTSNHGWGGAAVDHTTDKGRRVEWLKWLVVWAQNVGYSWEAPTEDWHIRYCLGDLVSQTTIDVEACWAQPVLAVGSTGDHVKVWQALVGATQDGQFGPKTKAATIAWQQKQTKWYGGLGLIPDGTVGADDWYVAGQ